MKKGKKKMQTAEYKIPNKFTPGGLYTWSFESSRGKMGGATINYVVQLNENGSLSCNCTGWIMGHSRRGECACKHTKAVASERDEILKKIKNGETINKPVMVTITTKQVENVAQVSFGRSIDLD